MKKNWVSIKVWVGVESLPVKPLLMVDFETLSLMVLADQDAVINSLGQSVFERHNHNEWLSVKSLIIGN